MAENISEEEIENPKKQVQIEVFCVIRPEEGVKEVVKTPSDQEISAIFNPPEYFNEVKTYKFKFSRVYGTDSTAENVFASASECIRSCLDDANVFIYFFGGHESGKSHLMRKPQGFVYLTAFRIFSAIEVRTASEDNWKFSVEASSWDIYDNDIIDMLVVGGDRRPHSIVEEFDGKGYRLTNLSKVEIATEKDVLKPLELAEENRETYIAFCKSEEPPVDSRMSTVFQFHVKGVNKNTGEEKRGSIFLVELAENVKVVHDYRIVKPAFPHVTQWREFIKQLHFKNIRLEKEGSKLIKFIGQNYQKLPSKTLVYATIFPGANHWSDSKNTLKFADYLRTHYFGSEIPEPFEIGVFDAASLNLK